MSRTLIDRSRYEGLRNGRRTLGLLAPLIQLGFLALGLASSWTSRARSCPTRNSPGASAGDGD